MEEKPIVDTPAPAETKVDTVVPEKTDDKSVAEIIETAAPENAPAPKTPDTVGLDKFLDVKSENKELKKQLKDLQASIDGGASATDIADDINSIAEEFDVSKEFLSKLTKAIKGQAKAETLAETEERLKPIQKKDRDAAIDAAFETHYAKAIKDLPEYAAIANAQVIKQLSLLPANKDKTFPQIIEETYGNALPEKRPADSTKPGGGKEPETLDIDRARKDTEYFKEVMANPQLKKEYNAAMLARRM